MQLEIKKCDRGAFRAHKKIQKQYERRKEAEFVRIWKIRANNTRRSHVEASGQVRALDEPFSVGGELLRFPQDPEGSHAETCNCRCHLVYRLKQGSDAPVNRAIEDLRFRHGLEFRFDDLISEGGLEQLGRPLTGEQMLALIQQVNTELDAVLHRGKGKWTLDKLKGHHLLERAPKRISGGLRRAGSLIRQSPPQSGGVTLRKVGDGPAAFTLNPNIRGKDVKNAKVHFDENGLEDIHKKDLLPFGVAHEQKFQTGSSDEQVDALKNWSIRHEVGHLLTDNKLIGVFRQHWFSLERSKQLSHYASSSGRFSRIPTEQAEIDAQIRESIGETFAWYTSPDYPRDQFDHSLRLPREIEAEFERILD